MKSHLQRFTAACCLVISLSASAATIVYDNFDPTPSPWPYALSGSWTGNFLPTTYAVSATTFVPTGSGALDELHLGLTNQKLTGSNLNTLTLYADAGGAPGGALWSGVITVSPVGGSVASLTGIGGPLLSSGVTYWLDAAPPADTITLHGWYSNNQGDQGPIISAGTPFANADRFALQVGVRVIPEPSTLVLLGLAVVVAGSQRRFFTTKAQRTPSRE